jgi:hypothetical protein
MGEFEGVEVERRKKRPKRREKGKIQKRFLLRRRK